MTKFLKYMFGERRLVNPARITAVSIQREHMADVAEIMRQAEAAVSLKHRRVEDEPMKEAA